jgi:hypothetical protein
MPINISEPAAPATERISLPIHVSEAEPQQISLPINVSEAPPASERISLPIHVSEAEPQRISLPINVSEARPASERISLPIHVTEAAQPLALTVNAAGAAAAQEQVQMRFVVDDPGKQARIKVSIIPPAQLVGDAARGVLPCVYCVLACRVLLLLLMCRRCFDCLAGAGGAAGRQGAGGVPPQGGPAGHGAGEAQLQRGRRRRAGQRRQSPVAHLQRGQPRRQRGWLGS